jgi:hypothetical protein
MTQLALCLALALAAPPSEPAEAISSPETSAPTAAPKSADEPPASSEDAPAPSEAEAPAPSEAEAPVRSEAPAAVKVEPQTTAKVETRNVETVVEPPPEPAPAAKPKGKVKRGRVAMLWSMGQTVGASYTFVDRFTARGIDVGFTYDVLPFFRAGISGGYIDFRDKFRRTVVRENAALNSTQLRILGAYSILATATVHLLKSPIVQPYAGLGLGTYFTFRSLDIGWVYAEDSGWHFGLAPMLGLEIDAKKLRLILGSRFNWVAKAGDSPEELFFTFNVGVNFAAF